jgi:hypothetical protein
VVVALGEQELAAVREVVGARRVGVAAPASRSAWMTLAAPDWRSGEGAQSSMRRPCLPTELR